MPKNVYTKKEVEALMHSTWIYSVKRFNNPHQLGELSVPEFIKDKLNN